MNKLTKARSVDPGVSALEDGPLREAGDGLARLLTNALDNALRHTPPGGRVDVAVLDEDEATVLSESDTGLGLPEAELERVFEPFRRGDDVRGAGAGLGLAICREIAARLGGSVTLANRPGVGLEFRYAEPRCSEPAADATEAIPGDVTDAIPAGVTVDLIVDGAEPLPAPNANHRSS